MANPYNPENHADPKYFGGRKEYLSVVKERISNAEKYGRSSGILVYGYRGIGKTSMLYKIMAEVENRKDVVATYRRLSTTTTDKDLYRIISEEVVESFLRKTNPVSKFVEGAKKNVSAIHTPFIDIDIKAEAEKSAYHLWQKVIERITNTSFILLEIDDADYLSTEALGELKTIVESRSNVPIILVASGGEGFEEKLDKDYSPVARIFSGASFNLESFSKEELGDVLIAPISGTKTEWEAEAINKVADLSNGYPYLVQCIAAASYLEKGAITKERVEERLKAALEIGRPWLNNEMRNASDNDIISFSRIGNMNKSQFSSAELIRQGISPVYVGRLVSLKVLKKVSRGRYKLMRAPIIAYYHMLTRGLQT